MLVSPVHVFLHCHQADRVVHQHGDVEGGGLKYFVCKHGEWPDGECMFLISIRTFGMPSAHAPALLAGKLVMSHQHGVWQESSGQGMRSAACLRVVNVPVHLLLCILFK